MAQKRKHESNKNWKPMTIECSDGLTAEDFQGLVALEELKDYQIIKDEPKKKIQQSKVSTADSKKKKKRIIKSNQFEVLKTSAKKEIEDDYKQYNDDNDINISEWEKLSVPKHIIRCLHELKMLQPTLIQQATIPSAIVEKLNIYGAAPTGSGKTLAFAIPIVSHIVEDKNQQNENNSGSSLKSIILTPTRELAVQIKKHIENICRYNQVKIALIVGGLAIQKQERVLLKKKPDIVVATPGRLWEIITNNSVSYLNKNSLINLKYLVIDEADRMVEKSHFKELRLIIDMLNEDPRNPSKFQRCQVLIFSATLTMVKRKNKKFKNLKDDSENLIKLLNLDLNTLKICDLTEGGLKSKPDSERLTEFVIHCLKDDKDLYLYYFVIHNLGRTIVFCNSIDCIRRLLNLFRFLQLNPLAIHSSMPQKRRLTNIERFSSSKNALLFATDVAARGLDVPNVDHVVHYQVPRSADIYVHRSGRTARIQNKGLSLILCDPKEEAFFLNEFPGIITKETLKEYSGINSRILKRLKERMKLAKLCDSLEHKLRKDRSEENWFRTTAEACELVLDDSDDNNIEDQDQNASIRERKDCQRKLKVYQKELDRLL